MVVMVVRVVADCAGMCLCWPDNRTLGRSFFLFFFFSKENCFSGTLPFYFSYFVVELCFGDDVIGGWDVVNVVMTGEVVEMCWRVPLAQLRVDTVVQTEIDFTLVKTTGQCSTVHGEVSYCVRFSRRGNLYRHIGVQRNTEFVATLKLCQLDTTVSPLKKCCAGLCLGDFSLSRQSAHTRVLPAVFS